MEVWCQCYSFPAGSNKPQLLCLMPEVSYELFPAWLQVSSLLWEKLWSFAKIIENGSTLHFLLNNNIPMFVLLSFILFCLQLMVVWWSSDWTKKFKAQKFYYNSYVLLSTTNTFLPFHKDVDTNLPPAVGSKSKCKFRPYHFKQKIVTLNSIGLFVFFPCMQNKVRNAADNFFPLQLQRFACC